MSPIRGAKGRPRRERKISKIALVVQPKVNSISPAADRSNGQETTAENKAPRCSQGPARPPAPSGVVVLFGRGGGERFPPRLPPHLPSSRVSGSGEERQEGGGQGRRLGKERPFDGGGSKRLPRVQGRPGPAAG